MPRLFMQRHDQGKAMPWLLESNVAVALTSDFPALHFQRLDEALAGASGTLQRELPLLRQLGFQCKRGACRDDSSCRAKFGTGLEPPPRFWLYRRG